MALAIALLLKLNAFNALEQVTYQRLFQARGARSWDDRLVLVAIDEASLAQLGRFPWSRQYYTQLLNVLTASEASVVVMNLIWSEPSTQDAELAKTMMQHGHVVLAQAWDEAGRPLVPVPDLANAAIATGHVMQRQDSDGIPRQIDPVVQDQPALSIAATQTYSLTKAPIPTPPLHQPLWVNWVGPHQHLRTYSFAEVIRGQVPAAAFRDKIVLVGVTATGLAPLVTPFDTNPPTGSVYLHATLMQNLLQQNSLLPLQGSGVLLLLLLSAPGWGWLISNWHTRQKLIAASGLCVSWGLLCLLLFQLNYWLPVTPAIALWVATTMAVVIRDQLREEILLRQHLAYLWNHYRQELQPPPSAISPLLPTPPEQPFSPPQVVSRVEQLATIADRLGRTQAAQRAIAQTIPLGLVAADLDGTVWFCNPVAVQWLHITIGRNLSASLVPAWLNSEQWQTSLNFLKLGKSIKHSRLRVVDRWFDLLLQPLNYNTLDSSNSAQELQGFLVLLEDVTEHKQVEMTLQHAKETALREAEQSVAASHAKSEFLASMSHELRTPLNVILGFTQVLNRDRSLSVEQQNQLEVINRSGQHLLDLINDVLEMSKIEAGRLRLKETQFSLHQLLDDIEQMFLIKAKAKQLQLIVERSARVPEYIEADEGKLRQVLLNLLGNAIKFTNAGQVSLRVCSPRDSKFSQVSTNEIPLTFEVEDTGPGITPEDLNHIFQPFTQTKVGQQTNEGTGLGLSISQKFVHLMGGNIIACSAIDQGTTFKFQLRVKSAQLSNQCIPVASRRVMALAPNQPPHRILVTDDQPDCRQFLVQLLISCGFDVREAENGRESITVWESWHPHLILMDMRMPTLSGSEATKHIRTQEAWINHQPKTKIIALTASVFEETQKLAATIGCDDFLPKPVQAATLLAKLAEHLNLQFCYETEVALQNHALEETSTLLTPAELHFHLTQMPIAWIEQLYEFSMKGSDDLIRPLIEQIPAAHGSLAQVLTDWVGNFQFENIITLTQPFLNCDRSS